MPCLGFLKHNRGEHLVILGERDGCSRLHLHGLELTVRSTKSHSIGEVFLKESKLAKSDVPYKLLVTGLQANRAQRCPALENSDGVVLPSPCQRRSDRCRTCLLKHEIVDRRQQKWKILKLCLLLHLA